MITIQVPSAGVSPGLPPQPKEQKKSGGGSSTSIASRITWSRGCSSKRTWRIKSA